MACEGSEPRPMKNLSIAFSVVMLTLFVHLGLNGFEPASGLVGGNK